MAICDPWRFCSAEAAYRFSGLVPATMNRRRRPVRAGTSRETLSSYAFGKGLSRFDAHLAQADAMPPGAGILSLWVRQLRRTVPEMPPEVA
jgi:hypothetical protein